MNSICLMDTSVWLNLLNVPGRNQDKAKVIDDYKVYVASGCTFILPMATILETGNHIAQCGSGRVRRAAAERFVDAVKGAIEGFAPWRPSDFPDSKELGAWIDSFPQFAMQNKSSEKTSEGTSFGDLSIIKEYEKCCAKCSMSEVFIWSLDSDLSSYHHRP
ncbi:hypothetical protein [Desulfoluna sp.]|uniref:hypothetical protein n=1 Tax=Desulfoluna sp. TaxID=2045199 RepID=UPI0026081234|nr:hypothetical protein [Desulfoluna sp.]